MSWLYPRTISIYRQALPTAPGLQMYADPGDEQLVASGIAASIQLKKETGTQPAGLPADIGRRTYWKLMFRGANGLAQDADTVVDDLGVRYQIIAAYWNNFGFACLAERMEA